MQRDREPTIVPHWNDALGVGIRPSVLERHLDVFTRNNTQEFTYTSKNDTLSLSQHTHNAHTQERMYVNEVGNAKWRISRTIRRIYFKLCTREYNYMMNISFKHHDYIYMANYQKWRITSSNLQRRHFAISKFKPYS